MRLPSWMLIGGLAVLVPACALGSSGSPSSPGQASGPPAPDAVDHDTATADDVVARAAAGLAGAYVSFTVSVGAEAVIDGERYSTDPVEIMQGVHAADVRSLSFDSAALPLALGREAGVVGPDEDGLVLLHYAIDTPGARYLYAPGLVAKGPTGVPVVDTIGAQWAVIDWTQVPDEPRAVSGDLTALAALLLDSARLDGERPGPGDGQVSLDVSRDALLAALSDIAAVLGDGAAALAEMEYGPDELVTVVVTAGSNDHVRVEASVVDEFTAIALVIDATRIGDHALAVEVPAAAVDVTDQLPVLRALG